MIELISFEPDCFKVFNIYDVSNVSNISDVSNVSDVSRVDSQRTIRLGKLYTNIFSSYDCFSSSNSNTKTMVNKTKYVKSYIKKKSLKGVLNCINVSNYEKQSKLILEILENNKHNLYSQLHDMINIWNSQALYHDLFLNLLHDIIRRYPNTKQMIREYIDMFLQKREWCEIKSTGIEEYSDFCDGNKKKQIILAKSMLLIKMNKYNYLNNINVFLEMLMKDFEENIKENTDDSESVVIIILTILKQIKDNDIKLFNIRLNEKVHDNLSFKIKYLIEMLGNFQTSSD